MRKITQFLGHKADFGCPRCKFQGEREPGTSGASGKMSYFTDGVVVPRNHQEVVQQAKEYLEASSKSRASAIAQKYGVRYSELLRLPYFDIVKMSATDPMHTFLLGLVKRETELTLKLLDSTRHKKFLERIRSVRMPYDVGRLPTGAFDDQDYIPSITADQWKTYIVCYAKPCMFNLLPEKNYQCLVLLSDIVRLVASPIFTEDTITTLYRQLHKHHRLFKQTYGKWSLTVNYHICLHLPEIIGDLGPPNAFWCFAYERMNGIFAGIPTNKRLATKFHALYDKFSLHVGPLKRK